MSVIILAILLWIGALVFFLLLVGGVRQGDEQRARALAALLEENPEEGGDSVGAGRLAAPPRVSRPTAEGRRPVASDPLPRTSKRLTG